MKTTPAKPQPPLALLRVAGLNLAFACGLSFTASCSKESNSAEVPRLDSHAVASVQGCVIREECYRQKLRERMGRTGSQATAADRAAVLEEMIRQEAVYAQAKAAKFDEQPELAARIKNLIVSRFIEQQIGEEPGITNEEIVDYYTSHSAEFTSPVTARAAMIFLRAGAKMASEKREELKRRAQLVMAQAQQATNEADFARLVQQHSEHQSTRYRAGDLGWMTAPQCEGAFGAEVSAALFALEEANSFAPLLETAGGFYILKLRERQAAQPRSLAEMQELIRYRLLRERRFQREEGFYVRMKEGLDVQINQPLIDSISIPSPSQHPPGLPGAGRVTKFATR